LRKSVPDGGKAPQVESNGDNNIRVTICHLLDDTRAYVVMPSFEIFEEYARRVEAETPADRRRVDK
jgi:hypothetical protein